MNTLMIFALTLAFVALTCRSAKASTEENCEAIRYYLSEEGIHFDFDEENNRFTFGMGIGGRLQNVRYHISVNEDNFSSYVMSPINADKDDEDMMIRMAEFICRANYGLRNGNFELDMRDGEIRYKVFVDCEDIIPSRNMVRNAILVPSAMFVRYAPGIIDVMFKEASAEDAIKKCEN